MARSVTVTLISTAKRESALLMALSEPKGLLAAPHYRSQLSERYRTTATYGIEDDYERRALDTRVMHYCYESNTLPRPLIRLLGLLCLCDRRWQAQEDPHAVWTERQEPR